MTGRSFAWSPERRIAKHIEVQGDCWVWIGSRTRNGYGQLVVGGRHFMAHRWVYEQTTGRDPGEMDLDHLCRNRACVNPEHLEVVTRSKNLLRGHLDNGNRRKTHCPKGHIYDDANTRITRKGSRACRTCERQRAAERRALVGAD